MADRMLFVSWGAPVHGREERGLEVFNEAVGLYGRLQQEGKIEGFDVALMEPNGTLNGYIQVRGSADQLAALRESEEWRRLNLAAALIADDFRVTGGLINEGVAEGMGMYTEAIGRVPQIRMI